MPVKRGVRAIVFIIGAYFAVRLLGSFLSELPPSNKLGNQEPPALASQPPSNGNDANAPSGVVPFSTPDIGKAMRDGFQQGLDDIAAAQRHNARSNQELARQGGGTLEVYRARLSARDHFTSGGHDLRRIPNIKPSDILLQDRLNFHRFTHGEAGDQSDSLFGKMSSASYRSLFEERPWRVYPAGGGRVILYSTPLVEVTITRDGNIVRILEATAMPR